MRPCNLVSPILSGDGKNTDGREVTHDPYTSQRKDTKGVHEMTHLRPFLEIHLFRTSLLDGLMLE